MNRTILMTRETGEVTVQLYYEDVQHPAYYNNYRGIEVSQNVTVRVYGVTATISEGRESIVYDSGGLSAQNYEVNYLFHQLCRSGYATIDEVRTAVRHEYSLWCRNRYSDAISKRANQILKRKVRQWLY